MEHGRAGIQNSPLYPESRLSTPGAQVFAEARFKLGATPVFSVF